MPAGAGDRLSRPTNAGGPRPRAGRRAAASMSSSVVLHPTERRSERWASTPMASSTGDGSSASDEHALPEWAATPRWSRPSSTAWGSTPSMPRHTRWGRRRPVGVAVAGATPSTAASPSASTRSVRRSVRRLPRRPSRPVGQRLGAPRRSPTMAGTFSMPARRARSWSPPSEERREPQAAAHAAARRCRAGPPNLWPLTDTRSAPSSPKVDRHVAGGLGGVDVHQHARARGTRPPPRPTGWSVPTSWLPHWTCTSAVSGRDGGERARRGRRGPTPSTPTTVTEPPGSANAADDWRTAECSTAASTTWVRRRRRPGAPRPRRRRRSASVAPLVNTTSRLRAPSSAATCSRASSTRDAGRHPLVVDAPGVAGGAVAERRRASAVDAPRAAAARSTRGRGSGGPSSGGGGLRPRRR